MTRKLRVGFDGRHLLSAVQRGMDRYTISLLKELSRYPIELTVFHRAKEPLYRPHFEGIPCQLVALADRGGYHWEQVAVPRALRERRMDIYHAPAERGVPILAPCPVVFTYHSATVASYRDMLARRLLPGQLSDYVGLAAARRPRGWVRLLSKLQLLRADHLLTPSEFARSELIRLLRVPASKVSVTPLATDAIFGRPKQTEAEGLATLAKYRIKKPYLLYVGGYEPHKNVLGVLRCARLVRQTLTQLHLVCVGSSVPGETLLTAAQAEGLEPGRDVTFLSNLCSELVTIYDESEAFLSLSWRESFGLPALEALSRGVLPVVSAWGAAKEVVGGFGVLVDPRESQAAATKLVAALSASTRPDLKVRRREHAARFQWSETARLTHEVYERCLRRQPIKWVLETKA